MTVDSDQFTHGTSEQRVSWFRRGYDTGDPRRCTTFQELLNGRAVSRRASGRPTRPGRCRTAGATPRRR